MPNNQIKPGQTVTATFPWREDELPTAKNFFTGKVKEIIQKSEWIAYVRIEGLQNLVPMDRVSVA